MKRSRKVEDILKEVCQAFGTIVGETLTLDEAFEYPITSVPLSIATVDGDLRKSENTSLKNFLINKSNAATSCILEKAT